MAGFKKVVVLKNQFFHAREPCKGSFEIRSHCVVFLQFLTRASNGPAPPMLRIGVLKSVQGHLRTCY